MEIIVGNNPIAVRQQLLAAQQLGGDPPELSGAALVIVANDEEIYKYGDESTQAVVAGDKAGEFAFGLSEAVLLLELHVELGTGSVIDVKVVDSDDAHPRVELVGQSGDGKSYRFSALDKVYLLPGQKLVVEETSSGTPTAGDKYVTVYVAKQRAY